MIELLSFNASTGRADVTNGTHTYSVDIPIQDDTYIAGSDLMRYLQGLFPVEIKIDKSKVQGADKVLAMCTKQRGAYTPTYQELRYKLYPPVAMFLDAWVKDDKEALELYRAACLAVKAAFPKPEAVEVSAEVLKSRREL